MKVATLSPHFLSVLLLVSISAHGETFYAVDSVNDKLIRIDTTKSTLTEVGSLGVDAVSSDGLVPLNSEELIGLFVVEAQPPGQTYYLYRISSSTGKATLLSEVIDGDGNSEFNLAEALALHPQTGEIFISYSSGAFSSSDLLGVVDPATGAIEQRCVIGVDMDNLLFDGDGSILALDVFPPIDKDLYRIDVEDCTATLLSKSGLVPVVGLGFLTDGSLIAVVAESGEVGGRTLAKLDASTGEIGETVTTISNGHLIRDIAQAAGFVGCEDELLGCQAELQEAIQIIQDLQDQLSEAEGQNAELLATLTAIGTLLDQIEADFQTVFRQPDFRIPGATTLERFQSLTAAILELDRGRKAGLFANLGGSQGR
jgi:hypothetical protein